MLMLIGSEFPTIKNFFVYTSNVDKTPLSPAVVRYRYVHHSICECWYLKRREETEANAVESETIVGLKFDCWPWAVFLLVRLKYIKIK